MAVAAIPALTNNASVSGSSDGRCTVRGFTLIELLVSIAIIAVLATLVFPVAEMTVTRQKESELRTSLRQIREALDAYKRAVVAGHVTAQPTESGYPRNLGVLVDGVPDAKNPSGPGLKFLRRIPRDPFSAPGIEASETWGKRSFASPPHDPREGSDVFDVYSKAAGSGLNGVPYAQW